jgi:hypothetical protein
VVDDAAQPDDILLGEARFRLDLAHYGDRADLFFKGDFVADDVAGDTYVDIRQAAILLRATRWLDVRAGRQVLTWGTGDLLFINDRFPKDFVSFFVGRADEYLKAPSNSLKATFYTSAVDIDFVWTPVFTPDTYITGERLSFFDPSIPGLTSATDMGGSLEAEEPAKLWENGQFAGRLYRTVGGYELAAYGYVGFTNQPAAFDSTAMMPTFSRLGVWGASARGNLLGGIGNIEGAYFDSYDDRNGTEPNIPNSEARWLAGYERELRANLTTGLQYYAEWTLDHDSLLANSPAPKYAPEEMRHLITLRLTQRLRQQPLTPSLFVYYSPNEKDGYARPVVDYKWSDAVTVTLGANLMWGDEHTFFGQLQDNSNVYARLRYSF